MRLRWELRWRLSEVLGFWQRSLKIGKCPVKNIVASQIGRSGHGAEGSPGDAGLGHKIHHRLRIRIAAHTVRGAGDPRRATGAPFEAVAHKVYRSLQDVLASV